MKSKIEVENMLRKAEKKYALLVNDPTYISTVEGASQKLQNMRNSIQALNHINNSYVALVWFLGDTDACENLMLNPEVI